MEVEAGAVFVVPPVFFGCEDLAEGKQKQKERQGEIIGIFLSFRCSLAVLMHFFLTY